MLNKNIVLNDKSINKLSNKGLAKEHLKDQLGNDFDFVLELWHAQGLEIKKHHGNYFFATKFLKIKDAEFCIVDIETNGSKIEKHQIIEIGAVKVKNGEVIDRYESLVHTESINKHITEITGISAEDTKDAPELKHVLYKFKEFLGDAIFVAHDVKFDYNFISSSMQKIGLAPLLNRSLCSLQLAQRTVVSYRYSLSYLNEFFNLYPDATHHRAMSDVLTTYELFKLCMKNLDKDVKTVEDLIKFSKHAKMLKRPKLDPLYKEEESTENSED
ncbi:3'-5' exonuclease [Sulfurimonas sp.]|uniref:3'-5' exonuclease n=1 Tax=Sulfurimonas sp. TaxID=2022749 RepID=UPI0035696453